MELAKLLTVQYLMSQDTALTELYNTSKDIKFTDWLSENYLDTINDKKLINYYDANYESKLEKILNSIKYSNIEQIDDVWTLQYIYENILYTKTFTFKKIFNLQDILTTIYYLRQGYTINECVGTHIEIKTQHHNIWTIECKDNLYCNCPDFTKHNKCVHTTIANVYIRHRQVYKTL